MEHQDVLHQEMQRLNIEHCAPSPFDSGGIIHSSSVGTAPDGAALSSLAPNFASNSPRKSLAIEDSTPVSTTDTSNFLSQNILSSLANTPSYLPEGGVLSSPVPSPPPPPLMSAVPLNQRYSIPNIIPATRTSSNGSLVESGLETGNMPQLPANIPGVMMGNAIINETDLEELARARWGLGAGTFLLSPATLLGMFGTNPAAALLVGNVGHRFPVHHRRHHTVASAQDGWDIPWTCREERRRITSE